MDETMSPETFHELRGWNQNETKKLPTTPMSAPNMVPMYKDASERFSWVVNAFLITSTFSNSVPRVLVGTVTSFCWFALACDRYELRSRDAW